MTTHGQYNSCHKWLYYNYGRASRCESSVCSRRSRTYHWALKKGKEHARNRDHYKQLCELCHRKYDIVKSVAEHPTPFFGRLYKEDRDFIKRIRRHYKCGKAAAVRWALKEACRSKNL